MKFVENNFQTANIYSTMGKSGQINVRVAPGLKHDLEQIAEFHGLTVSSYVHSVLTKHIRAEREQTPEVFDKQHLAPVVAHIGPAEDPQEAEREEIRIQLQRGMPLAASSAKKMPAKLQDKTHTQHKRKAR